MMLCWLSLSFSLSLLWINCVNRPCASQCIEHVDRFTCPFSTCEARKGKED